VEYCVSLKAAQTPRCAPPFAIRATRDLEFKQYRRQVLFSAARTVLYPASMIGQTISHYRILEKIGEGGMGVVYKAEDTRLGRVVALKFLSARQLSDDDSRKRFIREAKAAAALNHQNICTVYEIDEVDGHTFIAMTYVEGEGLDKRISAGPLPLRDALDIAQQISDGLQDAHGVGIVHRDIKPANIMLTPKGDNRVRVTIMDFGLAQLAHQSRITLKGTIMGTVAYMSPEQTYVGEVDHRSDIWSLGVVLYEMVTGVPPFRGHYDKAVIYSITDEDPEPITALRAGVPLELDWVVSKALAKAPADRYQSAAEFGIDVATLKRRLETRQTGVAKQTSAQDQRKMLASPAAGKMEAAPPSARGIVWKWVAAAAALVLASVLVLSAWRAGRETARSPSPYFRISQVTYDSGLTFQPSISPDGTLIAFASDRSGNGNLDIWLRHLGGGEPIRLTQNEADESEPSFSPDGSRIVFRSERDGGGVYVIPVLGGEPRLLGQNGRNPQVSPDGRWIAYWVGQTSSSFTGEIFLIEAEGGSPRRLRADFATARNPVWLPGGNSLLFAGVDGQGNSGWWVTPLDDGPPRRAAIGDRFPSTFPGMPYPAATDANSVLFAAEMGTSVNIWRKRLLPAGDVTNGPPERVTAGSGYEAYPSAARNGRMVFSSVNQNVDIMALPLGVDGRPVQGSLRRVTELASREASPSITLDGRILAFDSNQAGNRDIWIKDLTTGTETMVTAGALREDLPQITPDGSKMAYRQMENNRTGVAVHDFRAASTRVVCEECTGPYGWSPDGNTLLVRLDSDTTMISAFDLRTGNVRPLFKHPSFVLYDARFSWDGKWIALHSLRSPTTRQIFIVPFREEAMVPVEEWIPVSDGSGMDRSIAWAPGGELLYFLSERDRFRCIWAQPLDPATKQPLGDAFNVAHFHQASRSMVDAGFNMAVSRDSLFFGLANLSGNIWMLEPDAAE
jgi:eukaryotic-like serine/threonine-protein kinase